MSKSSFLLFDMYAFGIFAKFRDVAGEAYYLPDTCDFTCANTGLSLVGISMCR